MAQRLTIRLGTMRLQVQSLASLSELRIWRCCGLWCRLEMRLGSRIAMAVASAGSCGSESTPAWELPCAVDSALKKKKAEEICAIVGRR